MESRFTLIFLTDGVTFVLHEFHVFIDHLFNLKFAVKELERSAKRC
ncbi:unnamed protein product, partial [Allacma fusca]